MLKKQDKKPASRKTGKKVSKKVSRPKANTVGTKPITVRKSKQKFLLLETAATLLLERGYAGLTMDETARRLNIKKATLYYYIKNKEELVLEVYREGYRVLQERIWPIVDSNQRPDEKFRRIILEYINLYCTNVFFQVGGLRGALDLPDPHKNNVLKIYRKVERKFEEVVLEGQKQNVFKPIPPRLVVLAMIGMCAHVPYWYQYTGYKPEEIASNFTAMLELGWLKDESNTTSVYPRFESVDQAMIGANMLADQLATDIQRLTTELERTRQRLKDGLVTDE